MKITATVKGDLAAMMADEIRVGEMAATGAVAGVAGAIKANWRGQITRAGLGGRLANAVRSDVYPRGDVSLNAAGMVWSRAGKIVGAFERGVTIRAKDGFWLAIPTAAAGKSLRGGRITPGEWERRTGRRLRFVYRRGRTALLVDDGTVTRGARTMGRDGFSRAARGFRNRTVPVFTLVPQVTLSKRLGLIPAASGIAAGMGARLTAGWR